MIAKFKSWLRADDIPDSLGANIIVSFFRHVALIMLTVIVPIAVIKLIILL